MELKMEKEKKEDSSESGDRIIQIRITQTDTTFTTYSTVGVPCRCNICPKHITCTALAVCIIKQSPSLTTSTLPQSGVHTYMGKGSLR